MSLIENLEQVDRSILFAINGAHSPFLDQLMWWVSQPSFGIPFYLLFVFLLSRYFGWKQTAVIIIFVGCAVGLSDLSAKFLFKNVFERYRPSHNLNISKLLHYVNDYKGGLFGFVSSHAANMFAIATLLGMTFLKKMKYFMMFIFVWAALIGYSRVYLAVHYPSDVFVGALLGILIGILIFRVLSASKLVTLST